MLSNSDMGEKSMLLTIPKEEIFQSFPLEALYWCCKLSRVQKKRKKRKVKKVLCL